MFKKIIGWLLAILGALLLIALAVNPKSPGGGSVVAPVIVIVALLFFTAWRLTRKSKPKDGKTTEVVEKDGIQMHVARRQDGPAPRSFLKKTYRFQADYFVHTPLAAFALEGKTVKVNSTDELPRVNGGSWLSPDVISQGRRWDVDGSPTGNKAEEYKQFLLIFRAICEGAGTAAEKIGRLKALADDPKTKKWYNAAKKGYSISSLEFPDLALWYDLAWDLRCDVHQGGSLIAAGYETIESIAEAELATIKKLPRMGPKSAPRVIDAARKKIGLPPLEE